VLLGPYKDWVMSTFHMHTGGLVTFGEPSAVLGLMAAAAFVFLLPNSQQLLARFDEKFELAPVGDRFRSRLLAFRPTTVSAVVAASVAIVVLATIYSGVPSEFIYFQF
jgi:hypothetical protein